jgi:AcrR family transcriptional regulator
VSTAVEHEKRKREILDKALDVFVDSGYEDTTFQKIAERCGITRTILYLYFKNKKEIFASSIKWFTEKIEAEINSVVAMPSVGATRKLVMVGEIVVTNLRVATTEGMATTEFISASIFSVNHLILEAKISFLFLK